MPSRWRYRNWALAADGRVAYLDASPACWSRLSHYRIEAGVLNADTEECIDPTLRSATNGFSLDARSSYVSLASEDGSGIGFMPLPSARQAQGGFFKWLISMGNKLS